MVFEIPSTYWLAIAMQCFYSSRGSGPLLRVINCSSLCNMEMCIYERLPSEWLHALHKETYKHAPLLQRYVRARKLNPKTYNTKAQNPSTQTEQPEYRGLHPEPPKPPSPRPQTLKLKLQTQKEFEKLGRHRSHGADDVEPLHWPKAAARFRAADYGLGFRV